MQIGKTFTHFNIIHAQNIRQEHKRQISESVQTIDQVLLNKHSMHMKESAAEKSRPKLIK